MILNKKSGSLSSAEAETAKNDWDQLIPLAVLASGFRLLPPFTGRSQDQEAAGS